MTEVLRGDPLEPGLPAGARVDVLALAAGDPDPALVRGELLEKVEAGAGDDFDAWLLVERRRFAGLCEAVLRDAALEALAAGAPLEGAALASRALALNGFDDATHELLVRCLARAGEVAAAREHADACERLFRRELGRAPDPGVRGAVADGGAQSGSAVGDRAAALGQLEAGRAAVDAGAVEPGIACLREACSEARGVGDPALLGRTLAALGAALVHLLRGGDEEGSAVLHEALALAESSGDRAVACKVCRELGWVAVQAGRGVSAGRWLLRAGALARDGKERSAVLGVRGQALSDRAHYGAAIGLLEESVTTARRCGDVRQAAWSLAILGRALLLCGRIDDAVGLLDESLALVGEDGWVAFQPFPEALRAELALRAGDPDHAIALLDHAFPLGRCLGDPCWEAIAARARPGVRGRRRPRSGTDLAERFGGSRGTSAGSVRLDACLVSGGARRGCDRRRRARGERARGPARDGGRPWRHARARSARGAAPRAPWRPQRARDRPVAGRGDRQPGAARGAGRGRLITSARAKLRADPGRDAALRPPARARPHGEGARSTSRRCTYRPARRTGAFLDQYGPTKVLADSLGDRREELQRAWVEFFETEYRRNGEIQHTREYLLVLGERR